MALLELTLSDGRRIWAAAIHAEMTYAHMYEGIPDHESNDGYLAGFPELVERIFNGPIPVHVVEPDRKVAEVPYWPKRGEYLPPYWCAAEFYGDGMMTCLAVVWFQDDPFPIPSELVRPKLEAMNWEKHAEEFQP